MRFFYKKKKKKKWKPSACFASLLVLGERPTLLFLCLGVSKSKLVNSIDVFSQQMMKSCCLQPPHYYLSLRTTPPSSPTHVEAAIVSSLRSLYGVVGAPSLSVLRSNHDQVILCVPTSQYRRVWAAITLVSRVDSTPASILVQAASPLLLTLPNGPT